jgi:hypothetical protein
VAWSPFTGSVMTVARIGGVTPNIVSRGWNGRYSLASACAASVFVAAIALLKSA